MQANLTRLREGISRREVASSSNKCVYIAASQGAREEAAYTQIYWATHEVPLVLSVATFCCRMLHFVATFCCYTVKKVC